MMYSSTFLILFEEDMRLRIYGFFGPIILAWGKSHATKETYFIVIFKLLQHDILLLTPTSNQ